MLDPSQMAGHHSRREASPQGASSVPARSSFISDAAVAFRPSSHDTDVVRAEIARLQQYSILLRAVGFWPSSLQLQELLQAACPEEVSFPEDAYVCTVVFPNMQKEWNRMLDKIGSLLGTVLEVYAPTFLQGVNPYAPSATLLIPTGKILPSVVSLLDLKNGSVGPIGVRQRILYRGLPDQCRFCHKSGHFLSKCPKLLKSEVLPKVGMEIIPYHQTDLFHRTLEVAGNKLQMQENVLDVQATTNQPSKAGIPLPEQGNKQISASKVAFSEVPYSFPSCSFDVIALLTHEFLKSSSQSSTSASFDDFPQHNYSSVKSTQDECAEMSSVPSHFAFISTGPLANKLPKKSHTSGDVDRGKSRHSFLSAHKLIHK